MKSAAPSSSASKRPMDTSLLASTGLFKGLSNDQLSLIFDKACHKRARRGGFFFQEGDPADRLHILIKGKVRLTQLTSDGQLVIVRYITPVETFGLISVLNEIEYPVSAEVVEDSLALTWDETEMHKLMMQFPAIGINAIKILSNRTKEFQDRLRELSTERVERRLARALLRLVRQVGRKTDEGVLIDLPLSRQNLAEMTGTTLYTVSRTLSQWETQGIIQSGRERILIRYPHGLVTIAEDLPTR